MACRDAYMRMQAMYQQQFGKTPEGEQAEQKGNEEVSRLLFGVNTKGKSDNLMQNNITQFEWVVRNKLYPNYWGRNINGEDCLTKEEIEFLHGKGCKIAAIYQAEGAKGDREAGRLAAKKSAVAAMELGIPKKTAIFLEIAAEEEAIKDYLKGYAEELLLEGYTPGFRANTDAAYSFDREYSRGMQVDKDIFGECLIWAVTPILAEYDRITTSHLIHPDNWTPYAPSGIARKDIAVWQYGKGCHPIWDDAGQETTFDIDLVRNETIIVKKMF